MQGTRSLDLLEIALEADDLVADHAPVAFELAFARTRQEPEAAALALQVGPGANQARALIGQPRQLDLQAALAGAGAAGEDLQDQAGPVDHLDLPGLLQVALLNGREAVVHHDDVGLGGFAEGGDLLHLA